jgi:hypothetical protein
MDEAAEDPFLNNQNYSELWVDKTKKKKFMKDQKNYELKLYSLYQKPEAGLLYS